MTQVVTRFAPSPTGHLHIGGARTALFCWLLAQHFGGKFYLRIEDTDLERSKQEYTDGILAAMTWLGLKWDGEPVYQTQRTGLYNATVDKLLSSGDAYWCSCSTDEVEAMRARAMAKGEKPKYDGSCRNKYVSSKLGQVVRLKAPQHGPVRFKDMVKKDLVCDAKELDDMILRRSDGMPTYNLAVVVDDHDMGVTHVIRGDDHVANTFKQVLLYQALGWDLPVFGHVPMILGPDKKKLSKRHGARSALEYREEGFMPMALLNSLVRLGWSHGDQESFTIEELVKFFDGSCLSTSPSAFDIQKLQWFNTQILRSTPVNVLAFMLRSFLPDEFQSYDNAFLRKCIPVYLERSQTLRELLTGISVLLCDTEDISYNETEVQNILAGAGRSHLKALIRVFTSLEPFDAISVEEAIQHYGTAHRLKSNQFIPALRVAVTGMLGGPHLHAIINILGREKTLARMERALQE